jgi:nucleoside-diphosphate-sugar epimerase
VPTDINTVHEILTEITAYGQKPEYVPRPVGEVYATYLDSSKAKSELGWEPTVSLFDGLQQVIDWMRSQQGQDAS